MDSKENIKRRFKNKSPEKHVVPEKEKNRKNKETSVKTSVLYLVFFLFVLARFLAALYNQLWDCDEGKYLLLLNDSGGIYIYSKMFYYFMHS
jgi:hypothetical protein